MAAKSSITRDTYYDDGLDLLNAFKLRGHRRSVGKALRAGAPAVYTRSDTPNFSRFATTKIRARLFERPSIGHRK
jgi:hypothetical protein